MVKCNCNGTQGVACIIVEVHSGQNIEDTHDKTPAARSNLTVNLWRLNFKFQILKKHATKKVKVKEGIAVNGYSHLTANGRHLPYGITQCFLPPDTSERAPP